MVAATLQMTVRDGHRSTSLTGPRLRAETGLSSDCDDLCNSRCSNRTPDKPGVLSPSTYAAALTAWALMNVRCQRSHNSISFIAYYPCVRHGEARGDRRAARKLWRRHADHLRRVLESAIIGTGSKTPYSRRAVLQPQKSCGVPVSAFYGQKTRIVPLWRRPPSANPYGSRRISSRAIALRQWRPRPVLLFITGAGGDRAQDGLQPDYRGHVPAAR